MQNRFGEVWGKSRVFRVFGGTPKMGLFGCFGLPPKNSVFRPFWGFWGYRGKIVVLGVYRFFILLGFYRYRYVFYRYIFFL